MNRLTENSHDDWAGPLGAGIVITLLLCLALIAAGGWNWFSNFLSSSASGWAQAVGTVLAIYVTARIAGRDQRKREENDLIVAEFTSSKISGVLEPFSLQVGNIAEQFFVISRIDAPATRFAELLEELKYIQVEVSEEQLLRLAPVPKPVTHDIIDSIVLHHNMVSMLESTIKNRRWHESSDGRKRVAKETAKYLFKSHQLASSARTALLTFLRDRGVAVHNLNDH